MQVHDFGFLAFDPTQLQFMKSGNIALDPAAARVGLEVRVVGNDSGEKACSSAAMSSYPSYLPGYWGVELPISVPSSQCRWACALHWHATISISVLSTPFSAMSALLRDDWPRKT